MKRAIQLLIVIITLSNFVISCKKGDDDPFLSLRSRKARITGIWKMTSGTSNFIYNDTTEALTYNGINADLVVSTKDSGIIYSGKVSYSETWTISKSNTFEIYRTYSDYNISMTGDWVFFPKDKNQKLKNKEAILFIVKSIRYIYHFSMYNQTYTYTEDYCPHYLFIINQLKNKEMIVDYSGSASSTSIWPSETQSETRHYVLTQNK